MKFKGTGLFLLALAACGAVATHAADNSADAGNGTDPTRVQNTLEAKWERLDLRGGFSSDTLRLSYTMPVGERQDYSVRFRVPLASVDVLGNDSYALGDASVMVGHVFGLTRERGYVLQGEMIFDTADRPELGTGKDVFKGTFIYAKFLPKGAIFAPAFVHSASVSGESARADVNATTLDFYYVPKLKDPRNLVTYDPSLNVDWENDLQYAGLAITFGRVVGKALGGNAIVLVKPSAFAGDDRPGDWGIELGGKIVGF